MLYHCEIGIHYDVAAGKMERKKRESGWQPARNMIVFQFPSDKAMVNLRLIKCRF